jgi:hypothetical protein
MPAKSPDRRPERHGERDGPKGTKNFSKTPSIAGFTFVEAKAKRGNRPTEYTHKSRARRAEPIVWKMSSYVSSVSRCTPCGSVGLRHCASRFERSSLQGTTCGYEARKG